MFCEERAGAVDAVFDVGGEIAALEMRCHRRGEFAPEGVAGGPGV